MANSSDEAVGGEEKTQVSLSGLQRLSTRNTSAYDRHGNRIVGAARQVEEPRRAEPSSSKPTPRKSVKKMVKPSLKASSKKPRVTRNTTAKKSEVTSAPRQPSQQEIAEAEANALRSFAKALRITPTLAKELLVRFGKVEKIAKHLPQEKREPSILRVMGMTSERYREFSLARKQYLLNRTVTGPGSGPDVQVAQIARLMRVTEERVRSWRRDLPEIIRTTRRGLVAKHFERIAEAMGLSTIQLKQLISLDRSIAIPLRDIREIVPVPKGIPVENRAHQHLKEPQRAPGVRGAGISDLASNHACNSCGMVPDQNGFCNCR